MEKAEKELKFCILVRLARAYLLQCMKKQTFVTLET